MESEILKKLESIEKRLDAIEQKCSKMSGHVDFVERAYRAVRARLNYIMGSGELPPLLENKKLDTVKE